MDMENVEFVSGMAIILIWSFVGLLIGSLVGKMKGRTGAGALLGFLLGPIGWLVVALGPNKKPKCPECGGLIVPGAKRCKNCGATIGFNANQYKQQKTQKATVQVIPNFPDYPVEEAETGN